MQLQSRLGARRHAGVVSAPAKPVCRPVGHWHGAPVTLQQQPVWCRPAGPAFASQFIGELAAASYQASRTTAEQLYDDEEEEEEEEDEDGETETEQEQQQSQQQQSATAASSNQQPEDSSKQQPAQPSNEAAATATAAAASEATLLAERPQVPPEDELVTQEYTEEIVITYKPITVQSVIEDSSTFIRETGPGKAITVAAAGVLVGSFFLACYRYWQKYQSPRNVRKRQLNKNKFLVEELSKVFQGNRAKLNSGLITMIRVRTGFSNAEIFRKYLWYVLRERKFDQGAVDDVVALKFAAGLTDDQVAEALRERAQRIYDKYGTLMVNTEGMTEQGIQRKAACQALFRKMLYLTEHEALVKAGSPGASVADLRKIFGATQEDTDRLRIVTLYEEDLDLEKAYGITVSLDEGDDDNTTDAPKRPASPPPAPPQA